MKDTVRIPEVDTRNGHVAEPFRSILNNFAAGQDRLAQAKEKIRRDDNYRDMRNLLLKLYADDDFRSLIGKETLAETKRLIYATGGF
jgi:hypothetical protein